jgi:hypothetical protein
MNPEEEGLGGAQTLTQDPRVGPVVNSLWAMTTRVKHLEGWNGFYKGFMPTLTSSMVIALITAISLGEGKGAARGHYHIIPTGIFAALAISILAVLITLPIDIIIYRAITTPHKLGALQIGKSVRVLLTPYERRAPWILYFTPGLLASRFVVLFWMLLVVRTARLLLVPNLSGGLSNWMDPKSRNPGQVSTFGLTVFILFVAFSSAILCPLEVIATRLAIQRNHAGTFGAYEQANTAEGENAEQMVYAAEYEDVIALRDEEDPYTGLVDCAKRIVEEEGVPTLYRAWWLTLIAAVVSALG